jgi:carboxyl-terminal processing protease
MRGPVGTQISLTIARDKSDPFTVRLTREVIDIKSVTSRLEGDYGYIRLSGFDEKTGPETQAALRDLKAKDPNLKGLVLDLRNNPGGLVDQAVDVASDFLNGGEVVSQRGRDPHDITRYNARADGDKLHGLPMVVLINGGSASASEIVAGCLKDRERATIVGLTSFGKGSVQTVIPLRGGADGALKLTTDRYYTPSGGSIQKTGIAPDLFVANSKKAAEAVYDDAAFQYTEGALRNALDAQEGRVRITPKDIEIPAPKSGLQKASLSDDEDDDAVAAAKTPAAKLTQADKDKADFELQRALDVLRYGSVAAAIQMKPTAVYAKPTPKFTTAQAAPLPAKVGPGLLPAEKAAPVNASPAAAPQSR